MSGRRLLVATAVAGIGLAGCGASHSSGSGMMGGGHSSGSVTGPGRVGGAGGYHFARTTCSAPGSLAGHIVKVTLADMGMTRMMGGTAPMGAHMMLRSSVAAVTAGQVSFVAANLGWRAHELVILKLAGGTVAGHRALASNGKVSETSSRGEASRSCGSGIGAGITSGSVSWTTLTLTPGRYELICNLPNHYADGMYAELIVT